MNSEISRLSEYARLLSVLFYDPSEAIKGNGNFFEHAMEFSGSDGDMKALFSNLKDDFNAVDFQDLQVDYAKLFVGPFKLLANPYGSCYLENENMIMGSTTKAVEKLYLEAGLNVAKDVYEVSDHVAIELEFLHFLLSKISLNQDAEKHRDIFDRMYPVYCEPFFEKLSDKIIENAETSYYKNVGEILRLLNVYLKNT